MAAAPEPDETEHLWTIAVARLVFGADMNIQAPPNLMPDALETMIAAGINDWGGVSPVTPDHVNPEAPWPALDALARATAAAGKQLVERLAIYPAFARHADRWVDPALRPSLMDRVDADGWPRSDAWCPGARAGGERARGDRAARTARARAEPLGRVIGRRLCKRGTASPTSRPASQVGLGTGGLRAQRAGGCWGVVPIRAGFGYAGGGDKGE